MKICAKVVCHAVFLIAVSWNGRLAAQPLDLGRSSVAQAEEPSIHTPDSHGRDPLAANSAWFREFKRDVSNDSADPHSDQILQRLRKAKGTIDAQWSGPWTPSNWNWYTFPFQVVRGDVPPLTVPGTWAYNPASNGPFLLPPEPIVYENRLQTTYATAKWTDGADHHLCIYARDEATGGYKELWEYYQPWVTLNGNQITAVSGASWRKFDLLKGEVPAAGVPATDAAGMMIMPLVVRYDEVAKGSINHALRFCVNNSDISPTFKWPARTAAHAWNPETGMPYGTRLRIKASWWTASADAVLGTNTQARIVGEAMRRYGLILADGSGGSTIQLQGVADMRWEKHLVSRLNVIPVAAFEVVLTPPQLQITGPTNLQVGQVGTWTMTFLPDESPVGEGSTINIWDQNNKQLHYKWATINEAHRTVTAQRSFSQPGVYSIRPYAEWNTGFGPYRITVGSVPTLTKPATSSAQRQ
jgi:hypothetical protein